MPAREPGQAPEALVSEDLPSALKQGQRGRAGQRRVQLVGLGQQRDVGAFVLAPEGLRCAPPTVFELALRQVARDQPLQLRP